MSELSELFAAVDKVRLRQSRAIARLVDRRAAALRARTEPVDPIVAEDEGYDFAVALLAAYLDCTPTEVEEMGGSIVELGELVPRAMTSAGFAPGEAMPVASPRNAASSASTAPLPPAAATRPRKSAK
jgi:hypothetical protein